MKMNILRVLFVVALAFLLFACATVQEQDREDKENFRTANAYVELGLGYLGQGRVEAALETLKKAIAAKPDYAEAHSSIALAYGELLENEKAEKHYQRAMELSPKDGLILNNYAAFLCHIGRPTEAEKYFLKAIKSRNYPTPARALENLGVCALQIPDQKKAEMYLRKALQVNPRLPVALLNMAKISVNKKNAMSGRAYLTRYQEITALNAEGLWLGIQVENELGDLVAARDYENRLHRYFPDSKELRLLLESQNQNSVNSEVEAAGK